MLEISVRDAEPGDARAVARVTTLTWQTAYAHVFPAEALAAISEEGRARSWRETIESPLSRSHTLVAEEGGRVLGFASLGPAREAESEQIGELFAIYVLPEAWGRGIGRALMAEVLERLRSDGFEEVILWVLEDNPRTRRYYELAGWRLDGGAKDEILLDTRVREVRYRISLDPSR